MNRFRQVFLVIAAMLVASCSPVETPEPTDIAGPQSVTIMTFNVENLFDNVDDPGKDDKADLAILSLPKAVFFVSAKAYDSGRSKSLGKVAQPTIKIIVIAAAK